MNDPLLSAAGETVPFIQGGVERVNQILAVRAALVSHCCRNAARPLAQHWTEDLAAAWQVLRSAALLATPARMAEQEWRLRLALMRQLAAQDTDLCARMLSDGDRQSIEACGGRPPTVDAAHRMALMQQLITALQEEDPDAVLQVSLQQVESDTHEWRAFLGA